MCFPSTMSEIHFDFAYGSLRVDIKSRAVNQVGMPIDVRVVSCISIEIGRDATAFDNIYIYIFDC